MIEQIKTFDGNALAFEVIDAFTETDEKLAQKLFKEKLDEGYDHVNVLVRLDEMKLNKSSIKAFAEDTFWILKNYKKMGHLAIVGHSKVLKALVPIDNLFYKNSKKGRLERYFDEAEMDEAMKFISPN